MIYLLLSVHIAKINEVQEKPEKATLVHAPTVSVSIHPRKGLIKVSVQVSIEVVNIL